MNKPSPFVVEAGGGATIRSPLAGPMQLKADAGTTGGHFTLLENEVPPKAGPPLHLHKSEDEMYYVLEGVFRFKLADRMEIAPAGAFIYIPKGTPHCFQNIGEEVARFLVMFTPAGMEQFFIRTADLPPGPMDTDAHNAVADDCAMEILGPPLAISDPL